MGLLAELLIRTYHESQQKAIYVVRETRNIDAASVVPIAESPRLVHPR
jgi:hypothetical protein